MSGTMGLIHGELRWIFLLVALVGVVRAALALARGGQFGRFDRIVRAVYNGLLDLQALYGLVLVIYLWGRFGFQVLWWRRILHPAVMLLAVVVAHGARAFGGRDDRRQFRAQLAAYVISLAIIVVGVVIVQGGWLG